MNKKIPIKKSWGQNFLIDNNIIKNILSSIEPSYVDNFIEIGPGRGALTIPLSKQCKQLYAIEIDPLLSKYLNDQYIDNLHISNKDILKWDPPDETKKYKIIGNLPYNISSPIIFKFLNKNYWDTMIVMVQRELGNRIIAQPNSKNYSRISIMSQTFCNVEKQFDISNNVFYPKPEVQSTLIKFSRKNINLDFNDFSNLIKQAFKQRRKKLKNNLINLNQHPKLKKYSEHRPENISIDEYLEIFNNYVF